MTDLEVAAILYDMTLMEELFPCPVMDVAIEIFCEKMLAENSD